MPIAEFIIVMTVELVIFWVAIAGLQLLTVGSFALPVVSGLGLCVLALLTVMSVLALFYHERGDIIRDPHWNFLTKFVAMLTQYEEDSLSLTFTEAHVREISDAAFVFLTAFYVVYVVHVAVIWGVTEHDAAESADYFILLFRNDWSSKEAPAGYFMKLNAIVSVAALTLFEIIAYILYRNFLQPAMQQDRQRQLTQARRRTVLRRANRRSSEYMPSAFWYDSVGISITLQYTLYLYAKTTVVDTSVLSYAFIPWVLDFALNGCVAESVMHHLQRMGEASVIDNAYMWTVTSFYFCRIVTPMTGLFLIFSSESIFVHESFRYVSAIFVSFLVSSRLIECIKEGGDMAQRETAEVRSEEEVDTRQKEIIGVQQPRLFFKRRLLSVRSKKE